MIVFVTAYGEYALKAFGHAAADYVVKPVQAARLGMHGRAAVHHSARAEPGRIR